MSGVQNRTDACHIVLNVLRRKGHDLDGMGQKCPLDPRNLGASELSGERSA